jgi:hypothetical protein
LYSALPEWGSDSNTDFDIFIEQVHYFEKCGIENYSRLIFFKKHPTWTFNKKE